MSWYAEAVTIPLTGATKLYSRTTIPHNNPLYTKLYSKSNAVRQVSFPWQPLNQTHPLDCQMEKYDLSLHKSCIHCSRVQRWHALNHCMWCFALSLLMWGLDAAAWLCKAHPMKLPVHCSWANRKTWSLEVCCDWLCRKLETLHTMKLGIRWPYPVILHNLSLYSCIAVIPDRFHFVIMPLTADCGIFSNNNISQLDLLQDGILSWHHTGIQWAPESDLLFNKSL